MLVHFLYMKNKEMGSKGGHKLEQCYFCIDIIGTGGYMFFFVVLRTITPIRDQLAISARLISCRSKIY